MPKTVSQSARIVKGLLPIYSYISPHDWMYHISPHSRITTHHYMTKCDTFNYMAHTSPHDQTAHTSQHSQMIHTSGQSKCATPHYIVHTSSHDHTSTHDKMYHIHLITKSLHITTQPLCLITLHGPRLTWPNVPHSPHNQVTAYHYITIVPHCTAWFTSHMTKCTTLTS